ncbi:Cell division protein FtsN [Andreprevotia sp. IGB-42]|uniref:SPOR domain-containing protein n=1 Tax=Andreprevotia sp. IGB-42 TaxID=2497473 RepID=UPI00135B7679|nr:SPOR domain-containing protein [Andreprevotia sp. IGB-42]KAF0812309.1 Cell division protein FtsN [Andreprevotia sp. IGB-42]
MARDMKKSRSNGSRSDGGGSSLFTGLLIGLVGGVAVAVGLAFFLNRGSNPFQNKPTADTPPDAVGSAPAAGGEKGPEILRPNGAGKDDVTAPPVRGSNAGNTSTAASAASGVALDFYKVLPQLNDGNDKTDKPEVKKADVAPTAPVKVEAPKGAYLQVGAFQSEQDADNLKAKLALLGIEANIQSTDLADKGIWHRVRIGPFTSLTELEKTRGQLKSNGVDSTVVKGN